MFFDLILISEQHKSRMRFAWIAGTLGIRHVKKKDVLALDISKLCDDIANYVCSQSAAPRKRFSLRLSAILVNGTAKLYRQQAIFFQGDLFNVFCTITKPPVVRFELFETPPSPVLKKRSKKKPRIEQGTPESELLNIIPGLGDVEAQLAVVPGRAEDVTLRETLLPRPPTEEFGDLGTFEFDIMADIARLDAEQLRQPEPSQLIEIAEEPLQIPRKSSDIRSSNSTPEIAPIRFVVEAQVHASAGEFIQPQRRLETEIMVLEPSVAPEMLPRLPTLVQSPPIQEQPLEIRMQRDILPKPHHRRRKPDTNLKGLEKAIIVLKPLKVLRIDRCDFFEFGWTEISPPPLPEVTLKMYSLTNMINEFMMREPGIELRQRDESEPSSLRDSSGFKRKSRQATPPIQQSLETQILQAPGDTIREPLFSSTPLPQQITIEETIAAPAQAAEESPRKRRRLKYPEKEGGYVAQPGDDLLPSVVPTTSPHAVHEGRHQRIVDVVFAKIRTTLEEICDKPVNRLHIARAFNDCLVLCRNRYVTLVSKPESNELAFIEKGPKMFH